ncbi:calcium-binding protein 5-like [Pteropus vampyrus]|uniref:Calcium-binding protein 5-like n=1 Tax=Pteropus vampyrus TaxID=132908 RepID=A0A6P3RMK6_PTEVA|nr:calcium-binding protein 5-like [Pteropus vampyrus]
MQVPMGPACIFLRKGIAEKQRFDTNGDGEITLGELQQAMQRLLGEKLTPREISEVVREADVNGDGTVDFEEFVKMMSR